MLTQLMGRRDRRPERKGSGQPVLVHGVVRESDVKSTEPQRFGSLAGTAVAIIDDNRTNPDHPRALSRLMGDT